MIDREELERLCEAIPSQKTLKFSRYNGGYSWSSVKTNEQSVTELLLYLYNNKSGILSLLTERDALAAENARLEEANRTITAECTKWAREAGEAKGKLDGSEAAGIVDGWREKCERLEVENAALTAKVERLEGAVEWFSRHATGLKADVHSAHRARGNAASEWMREDDRDFRKELEAALDALKGEE